MCSGYNINSEICSSIYWFTERKKHQKGNLSHTAQWRSAITLEDNKTYANADKPIDKNIVMEVHKTKVI